MKVIVHEDRTLEILNQATTQNENQIEIIEFEFPQKYQNWNKKIVFILNNEPVWDLIQNNRYVILKAITQYKQVKFYVWLTHEEQDFRSETRTLNFNENIDASDEITPEEINAVNKILEEVDAALEEVDNVDININKSGTITTVTISKKDGTEKSVDILDGKQGQQGEPGYTPIKGVDYWTNEDKLEILNDIDSDIQEYMNQPFATFEIENGNLYVEVKEWQQQE